MSDYLIAGEDVEDYDPYAPTEEEAQMEADLEEMPQIEALPDEEDLNTVSAAELEEPALPCAIRSIRRSVNERL